MNELHKSRQVVKDLLRKARDPFGDFQPEVARTPLKQGDYIVSSDDKGHHVLDRDSKRLGTFDSREEAHDWALNVGPSTPVTSDSQGGSVQGTNKPPMSRPSNQPPPSYFNGVEDEYGVSRDVDGFDEDGFDVYGFDQDGFNEIGFNDEGHHIENYDTDGNFYEPGHPNYIDHLGDDLPNGNHGHR